MSLGNVQQSHDSFGYRLITPYGNVTPLAYSDLPTYRADENDTVVADFFNKQVDKLATNGLHPAIVMPGKAGALIVAGYASEAEQILDAAFGVHKFDRTSRIEERLQARNYDLKVKMLTNFKSATDGEPNVDPLSNAFSFATRKPDNKNFAPVVQVDASDWRLAA